LVEGLRRLTEVAPPTPLHEYGHYSPIGIYPIKKSVS
jgi:hypothetical protein